MHGWRCLQHAMLATKLTANISREEHFHRSQRGHWPWLAGKCRRKVQLRWQTHGQVDNPTGRLQEAVQPEHLLWQSEQPSHALPPHGAQQLLKSCLRHFCLFWVTLRGQTLSLAILPATSMSRLASLLAYTNFELLSVF